MNVSVTRLRDLRTRSSDAGFDAWLFNCLLDNNLLHSMNPQITASREQLRFMVHLEHDQPFLPCRDTTFFDLCQDTLSDNLKHPEKNSTFKVGTQYRQTGFAATASTVT